MIIFYIDMKIVFYGYSLHGHFRSSTLLHKARIACIKSEFYGILQDHSVYYLEKGV